MLISGTLHFQYSYLYDLLFFQFFYSPVICFKENVYCLFFAARQLLENDHFGCVSLLLGMAHAT